MQYSARFNLSSTNDIEHYTDDTNSYACASDTVISELQITASKLFTWFNNNHMKRNTERNNLLLPNFKTPKKNLY